MFIKLSPLNLSNFGTPCTVRSLVFRSSIFLKSTVPIVPYILNSFARIINKKKTSTQTFHTRDETHTDMETHTLSETSRNTDNFYTFSKYNKPLADFLFKLFISFLNDEEEETENRMFQDFWMNSRSILFQDPPNGKKKNKSSALTSSM